MEFLIYCVVLPCLVGWFVATIITNIKPNHYYENKESGINPHNKRIAKEMEKKNETIS